jgi:aminomethyltransferase
MGKKTPLYKEHCALNARMVEFGGWEMPLNYGSQIEEHQSVRHHAGLFDVSHMNIVDVKGTEAKNYLRYLLANDVEKLNPSKALYSCMLNEKGGVIDDLIAYQLSENHYQLVLNAATKEKDLNWLYQHQIPDIEILPQENLAILALQGPHALKVAQSVFSGDFGTKLASLKPFQLVKYENILAARTGYTGENGFEFIIKENLAVDLWHKLLGAGAHPIGLGARDTLRLEAGLNLYGQDMDEFTSPLESNLEWTVAWEPLGRDFVGRSAISSKITSRKLVGLILEKGGILRHDQKVFSHNQEIGVITSGIFSPTLNCSIAFARIQNKDFPDYSVEVRGKLLSVMLTKPVFVKHGKRVV